MDRGVRERINRGINGRDAAERRRHHAPVLAHRATAPKQIESLPLTPRLLPGVGGATRSPRLLPLLDAFLLTAAVAAGDLAAVDAPRPGGRAAPPAGELARLDVAVERPAGVADRVLDGPPRDPGGRGALAQRRHGRLDAQVPPQPRGGADRPVPGVDLPVYAVVVALQNGVHCSGQPVRERLFVVEVPVTIEVQIGRAIVGDRGENLGVVEA